jgi:EmrB/QacA subfamily drug resistance transporter
MASRETLCSEARSDQMSPSTSPAFSTHARLTSLIIASAFFMEQLDGSVIATSLPQIAASFDVHAVDVGIGMTAYLVSLAAFIPLSGWVADRIGARTTFCAAIVLFALTSMACGVSPSLAVFVAARIAQGAAGAMMVPVGRTVVLRSSTKSELIRAISMITWPGLIAPVLGPPIGGFITTYASWRWIFFLNVPIAAAGLIFALIVIRAIPGDEKRPFDLLGFLLSSTTLIAVMFGLDLLARGAPLLQSVSVLAAGIVLGALWRWNLRTSAAPILSFAAAAIPTFAASVFRGSFFRVAIQTTPFMLPLLFQVGLGRSAFGSGLLMLAYAAGNLGMKTGTTTILRRFGFRRVILVNGAIVTLSLIACAAIGGTMPDAAILAILFVAGLCRSMQYTTINALGFADVPPAMMGAASTLSSTIVQLAAAGGIAIGALLLHGIAAARHGGPDPDVTDFHLAFAFSAAMALATTVSLLSLPKDAGSDVSGHARPITSSP